MSRIRRLFIAIVAMTLLASSTHPAFAIRVRIASCKSVPFSVVYPEYARKQIRAALQSEGCNFIDGYSSVRVSTLHFEGDTTSVNKQLLKLADCPATTVAVSPPQDAIDASRANMLATVRALTDLGNSASEEERLKVLQNCIEAFNELDERLEFIETLEREDICWEFEAIVYACGLGTHESLADEWRDW